MAGSRTGRILAKPARMRDVPVWIDIRPGNGLETAHPGRQGRQRGYVHFATFGLSNTAFQRIRIVP
jgi:hypothetical protein